jgi:hypothetical protein
VEDVEKVAERGVGSPAEDPRVAGPTGGADGLEGGWLRQAGHGQVFMTGLGLQIPEALSFEDWERAGQMLSRIVDSSAWWLGDWLVFGKKNYSDRYQRAIRAAGLQYQTLRNYAWVARRFDLGRRRLQLTFQHHAEVASLVVEEQDQLLDQALAENWTTKQLRKAMRGRVPEAPKAEPEISASLRLELPDGRLAHWRYAAASVGLEFDCWVRDALDRAAEQVGHEAAAPDALT